MFIRQFYLNLCYKNLEIPQEVFDLAHKCSCNRVEYAKFVEGYGHVYSLWSEDENGLSIPIGLPFYILQNGDHFDVYFDRVFTLSNLLNS